MRNDDEFGPKEKDLYKIGILLTVGAVVFCIAFLIDWSTAATIERIANALHQPLEIKNWHYALLVLLIWSKK